MLGALTWMDLGAEALGELDRKGYGPKWRVMVDPQLAVTTRVARAALIRVGLWRFVGHEASSDLGCLHFEATDANALREALTRHPGFAVSGTPGGPWQARERRFRRALHFKQFEGWPPTQFQVHLDPFGSVLPAPWRYTGIANLIQLAAHALTLDGYRRPEALWRSLVAHDEHAPDSL